MHLINYLTVTDKSDLEFSQYHYVNLDERDH